VAVSEGEGSAKVRLEDGAEIEFDRVIIAAHADEALAMLATPDSDQQRLLAAFRYQENTATLHTDSSVMPRTRRAWASWNYRVDPSGKHSTHYWMNRLQGVSDRVDYFVSLNADVPADKVCQEIDYEHPLFDLNALAAQQEVPKLNASSERTYFVGAWTRYGFHEDGLLSAVNLCQQLVGGDPWEKK
jgi:predicted NAD/FAD-binding protein